MPSNESAVATYDFTWSADVFQGPDHVKAVLRRMAKHWAFQKERGEETGYVHWQARVSLKVRRRLSDMLKNWDKISEGAPRPHMSVTSGAAATTFDYVMKPDTRVEGPWTDKDKEVYIPWQYRGLLDKLYPWQQKVWDSADVRDRRTINLVYCPGGCKGKTTVAMLMLLYGRGIIIPPVNDAEKLVQSTCDILMAKECREPKAVFVDLPRAMNKEKLFGIYTAIEQVKNGYVYDMRYSHREWVFDTPAVWVFTNAEPDTGMLSADRWRVWTIDAAYDLQVYKVTPMIDEQEDGGL